MKQQIENAIRQHLIITNDPGVKYAVEAIYRLVEEELSCAGVLTGEDAERFHERMNNPVMVSPEERARIQAVYDGVMKKAKL